MLGSPITLLPRLIIMRLGMGALAGGIFSGLSSYLYTEFKYTSVRSDIEYNKLLNSKTIETEADIKRKKLEYGNDDNDDKNNNQTQQTNFKTDNNKTNQNKTDQNKTDQNKKFIENFKEYQLLELDANEKLTRQKLSDARNNMLLKWHPDIHKGDKELSTLMTIQINEAYTTLSRKIK